eukprot:8867438-Alexandrium_andersonii.AAC.1
MAWDGPSGGARTNQRPAVERLSLPPDLKKHHAIRLGMGRAGAIGPISCQACQHFDLDPLPNVCV